jgi:hypothetical protein
MNRKMYRVLGVFVVLSLILAACGGGAAPATPAPEAQPAAQNEAPTAEPPADQNSEPTAEPPTDQSSAPTPSDAPTAETPAASVPAAGSDAAGIVADSGFRPEVNGFQFENYGKSDAQNLTPAEMQRIFGDAVCASKANDQCVLTPPAEQWMKQQNQGMDGGHCFGFSVASLRLFTGLDNPSDYGGATTIELPLNGNEKLQRDIAYSFVFQGFNPVRNGVIAGTPTQVLNQLIEVLKAGKAAPDTYTIGFFKADGNGGHAVTPYAVENRGNGVYAVLIYDNNYPKETRAILFDRNADTWNYTTTTNPSEPTSEYQGNAQTKSLFLFPTKPGLQQQACDFCAGATAGGSQGNRLASAAVEYNEIYLDGDPVVHGHLLITDEAGKRYGYTSDGKFVTEISAVKSERVFSGLADDTPEPTYFVPTNMTFQITIDGAPLKQADPTDVTMIGPGYDLGVYDINLEPGQQDTLSVAPNGDRLSYTTKSSESPSIVFGVELAGADYEFEIKGVDVEGGDTINVSLDTKEGYLTVDTDGTKNSGTYDLYLTRIDDNGEQSFDHEGIELDPADMMYIYYGKWSGNGTGLEAGIDRGSDGTVDETLELTDSN